jgi:ADP-ribosylglycohydrolase
MEVVLASTTLAAGEYFDRVFACWLGKNCGGTLGQPLEEAFGRSEPFDVWWYPELAEGGIPNDDLEMQLVWLMAVVERWPILTARTLSEYWLDHIGYNYDEYGFAKTNLRLGLVPPVSGRHNNWFVDCMGSPIRSEIWACLAPGVPALAARLAYQDAICDHAGGEGVYGELFNASMESAAFVIKDMDQLLDIAMTYIPDDCQVARAIRSARSSHREGLSWTEARERVLETVPHYVAQYAPINLGFQAIAWLYGEDFGDAICKAVNCGYDTDCTGATVGSLLGILSGRAGLPPRWTDPLGERIATSESTGGIKHVSDGAFRVPETLDQLTSIVCGLGERLLSMEGAPMRVGDASNFEGITAGSLAAPDSVRDLWKSDSLRLHHELPALRVAIEYGDSAVVRLGVAKEIGIEIENLHPAALEVSVDTRAPEGWMASARKTYVVPAGLTQHCKISLSTNEPNAIKNSNRAVIDLRIADRPSETLVPLVLLGPHRWRVCGPFGAEESDVSSLFETVFKPEESLGGAGWIAAGPGWATAQCDGDSISADFPVDGPGVWYGAHYLKSPREEVAHIGIPSSVPVKAWLNGELITAYMDPGPYRPSYKGHSQRGYADVALKKGWNELVLKLIRPENASQWAAQVMLSRLPMFDGAHDVGWTLFPWEEAADQPRA